MSRHALLVIVEVNDDEFADLMAKRQRAHRQVSTEKETLEILIGDALTHRLILNHTVAPAVPVEAQDAVDSSPSV